MSAGDHLNPQQFFHGTIREGLSEIVPASTHGKGAVFPSVTSTAHAYATPDVSNAWHYAEMAWNAAGSGIPRVYQVEPLGEHEEDPAVDGKGNPRGNFSGDRRSTKGWRVTREVPMPENMGTPEDWR